MPDTDFYYHWSPTERRAGIIRHGLMPGKLSKDMLWRPPYICLSSYPSLAWALSGGMPGYDEIGSWDLWEVWLGEQKGFEKLFFDNERQRVKEVRVYERIYKRNVQYLATRTGGQRYG